MLPLPYTVPCVSRSLLRSTTASRSDRRGDTVLMAALRAGRHDAALLLLQASAVPTLAAHTFRYAWVIAAALRVSGARCVTIFMTWKLIFHCACGCSLLCYVLVDRVFIEQWYTVVAGGGYGTHCDSLPRAEARLTVVLPLYSRARKH